MTRIYARGDRIPPADRLHTSRAGDLKYWLLLPDGKPDPNTKPFARRWEIAMIESRGEYKIITGKVGKPATGFNKKEWQREYDRELNKTSDRKEQKKRNRRKN
jgi:hypothetical protein